MALEYFLHAKHMIIGKIPWGWDSGMDSDKVWGFQETGKWIRGIFLLLTVCMLMLVCMLTGCVVRAQKTGKIRDVEFTVPDKEMIPPEFSALIEENKEESFKLTYADQGKLYIAEGYGAQSTSGYSVEVKELYETQDAVHIRTNLLGPGKGEETKEKTTFPYVVIQMEYIEKDVLFD